MPDYTKKIILKMTDRVYEELKATLIIKKMSGNLYGINDEVFYKLMEAFHNKEETVCLAFKDEKGEK